MLPSELLDSTDCVNVPRKANSCKCMERKLNGYEHVGFDVRMNKNKLNLEINVALEKNIVTPKHIVAMMRSVHLQLLFVFLGTMTKCTVNQL